MISLETRMNSLNFLKDLETINNLLSKAHVVNNWFSKTVEVDGFEGSIDLDDLIAKVYEASQRRAFMDDLELKERIVGLEIVEKLNGFNGTSVSSDETMFDGIRTISRVIRRFPLHLPTQPVARLYDTENNFRSFSHPIFLQTFGPGATQKDIKSHPSCYHAFGPETSLQIIATKNAIQKLSV